MRLILTARGAGPAASRVESLADRLDDPRPAFAIVARALMRDEQRRFDTEGFGQWPELDPQTIRRKLAKGHSSKILQATGTLERALTTPGAPGQRLDIGRDQMRFGLTPNGAAYYGRFHQAGRGVPKRLVISVTPRQRREITGQLRQFILNTSR